MWWPVATLKLRPCFTERYGKLAGNRGASRRHKPTAIDFENVFPAEDTQFPMEDPIPQLNDVTPKAPLPCRDPGFTNVYRQEEIPQLSDDEDSDSGISTDESNHDNDRGRALIEDVERDILDEVASDAIFSSRSASLGAGASLQQRSGESAARCGVLLESLILDAIITEPELYTTLFVLTDKQEDSPYHQLDDPRLKVSHPGGDGFCVISVVRAWCTQLQEGKEKAREWCKRNQIHERNLQRIEQMTKDRYKALTGNCAHDLPTLKFSDLSDSEVSAVLQEILAGIYMENIYVYRGHQSLGYRNTSTGDCARLAMGSVFHALSRYPTRIVAFPWSRDIRQFSISSIASENLIWGIHIQDTVFFKSVIAMEEETVLEETLNSVVIPNVGEIASEVVVNLWKGNLLSTGRCLAREAWDITQGSPVVVEKSHFHGNSLVIHAQPNYHKPLTRWIEEDIIKLIRDHLNKESVFLSHPGTLEMELEAGVVCRGVVPPRPKFSSSRLPPPPSEFLSVPLGDKVSSVAFRKQVVLDVACRSKNHAKSPANVSIETWIARILDDVALQKWRIQDVESSGDRESICKVVFEDQYAASRAMSLLHRAKSQGRTLVITNKQVAESHLRTFDMTLCSGLYTAIKKTLNGQLERYRLSKKYQIEYKVLYDEQACQWLVQVVASTYADAAYLMETLREIVSPTICTIDEKHHRSFRSPGGALFLEHVMRTHDTFVSFRASRKALWVFGTGKNVKSTMAEIKMFTSVSLSNEDSSWHIQDFSHSRYPSDFFLRLLKRTGFDTDKLSALLSVKKCVPIPNKSILLLSDSDIQRFNEILRHLLESEGIYDSPRDVRDNDTNVDVVCAVCYTKPDDKSDYVLEGCGHTYCLECLKMQVVTSIKNNIFPLACANDDLPFTLADVYKISSVLDVCRIERLLDGSLRCFVTSHPDSYKYCSEVNCRGLLRVREGETSSSTIPACFLCKKAACPQCFERFHPGKSCQEYAELVMPLKEWMAGNPKDRKQCSNCNMGIEKFDGCNNVRCGSCKKNICWKCLKSFQSSKECYSHLDSSRHWR